MTKGRGKGKGSAHLELNFILGDRPITSAIKAVKKCFQPKVAPKKPSRTGKRAAAGRQA